MAGRSKHVAGAAIGLLLLTLGLRSAVFAEQPALPNLPPGQLRCEYFVNPMGVDVASPRFFWQQLSLRRAWRQTAYQVLVATSEELLRQDKGDLWDSGKIATDQSVGVPYGGRPLASRQLCWWKVRVWDDRGDCSGWSDSAFWRMGILKDNEWRGQWIASDLELKEYQETLRALPDFGMEPETEVWKMEGKCRKMTAGVTEAPAVYMRREFDAQPALRRATAYVCGLGCFELYLNGRRIGDHFLDPAYTDYQKRTSYLVYDVTDAIKSGRNAVGVILGNGWFNLITPHLLRFHAADYIAPPRLRLELDLEYSDGSHQTVGSDPSWKCTTEGPIRFNCILAGETYDARREMPNWDCPGFEDSEWQPVRQTSAPEGPLRGQLLPPVRKLQTLPAVRVARRGGGWRFDLGVETTGWARLRLRGKPGQEITVQYPGANSHTLGQYQAGKYFCRGGQEEFFEPRFCYGGFRFVDVTGLDYQPQAADCIGQLVATDMEPAGAFACSDERLCKLQEVLLRTLRNYYIHIPNDPTREKAGWTQDVETGFWETAYNFRAAPTYLKWQRDFLDIIHPNGYVPPVAPGRFDGPTINGPWWGGAIVYCPWYLYQFYGDTRILDESYPAMKRQVAYLGSIAKDHIITWGLGDWMEVGSVRPVRTPVPQTSTCAYYWFAEILRQTALLLGKTDDARDYAELAAQIGAAYNQKFFNQDTGDYANGSQTSQLISLHFGLVPEDARSLVLRRLTDRIAKDDNHLSTGFVGTPLLLPGLTELGRPDLAWTIATQDTYPSFIDAILNQGHTVMKEDWRGGLVQMPSLQGPIGTWFYHSLAGIRLDPAAPGFKRIVLRPETGGDLTWVSAHHDSLFGRIVSQWRRADGRFTLNVVIPANTTASVYVPAADSREVTESGVPADTAQGVKFLRMENGAAVFKVGSGSYQFSSQTPTATDTKRKAPPGR